MDVDIYEENHNFEIKNILLIFFSNNKSQNQRNAGNLCSNDYLIGYGSANCSVQYGIG